MKHSWKKIVQGKFIRQSFRATSLTALSGSISRIQTDKKKGNIKGDSNVWQIIIFMMPLLFEMTAKDQIKVMSTLK